MTNNSNKTQSARRWFVTTALSYLGTPYIWGGDDPSGFDCSGFVIECLKSVGLLSENEDFTADGLYRKFSDLVPRPTGGPAVPHLSSGLRLKQSQSAKESRSNEAEKTDSVCRRICDSSTDFDSQKGQLLFYLNGNGRVYHVVICLDEHFQIGASGGGKGDISPSNSWQDNAFVKIRPIGKPGRDKVLVDPFLSLSKRENKK